VGIVCAVFTGFAGALEDRRQAGPVPAAAMRRWRAMAGTRFVARCRWQRRVVCMA
jgi:hypothetical protein